MSPPEPLARSSRPSLAGHRRPLRRLATALSAIALAAFTAASSAGAQPADPTATGYLWLGTTAGLTKIDTQTKNVVLQVPEPAGATAMTVDWRNDILWVHTDSELHAVSLDGVVLFSIPLPVSGPASGLDADENDGSVWVVVGTSVSHYDMSGQLVGGFTQRGTILGLKVDLMGYVWIATTTSTSSYDPLTGSPVDSFGYGSGGTRASDIDLLGPTFSSQRISVVTDAGIFGGGIANGVVATPSQCVYIVSSDCALLASAIGAGFHCLDRNHVPEWLRFYPSCQYLPQNQPTPFPVTHIVAEGQTDPLLRDEPIYPEDHNLEAVWLASGEQYADGTLSVRSVGAGVQITAMAVHQRELTDPVLTLVGHTDGQWVATSTPSFTVDYSDPVDPADPRTSGVDPASLRLYHFYDDGIHFDPVLGSGVPISCTGGPPPVTCTAAISLSDGLHDLVFVLKDFARNEGIAWASVRLDGAAPTITITSPQDGAVVTDPSAAIQVTYSDPGAQASGIDLASLALLADGTLLDVTCTTSPTAATCTPTTPLPGGVVQLEARISDVAGNASSDSVSIVIDQADNVAPVLAFTKPSEGLQSTDPRPELVLTYQEIGGGVDSSTLALTANGAPLAVACSSSGDPREGSFICLPDAPFPIGTVNLQATLQDLSGNLSAVAARSFEVVDPWTTLSGTLTLPGGAPAVGADIAVVGKPGYAAVSDGSGAFTISDVPVATTEHLAVRALLVVGESRLTGFALEVTPIYGGPTDVGTIELEPLCEYHATQRFDPPGGRLPGYPNGSSSGYVNALVAFDDGTGSALFAVGHDGSGGDPGFLARWSDAGWDLFARFGGPVNALAVYDDGTGPALYVAGDFTTVDGNAITRIARWDGTSWSGVGGGTNAAVRDLEVVDDGSGPALYAAGDFLDAGGSPAGRVARWDGDAWTAVGNGLDAAVEAIEWFDDGAGGALYAGGAFDFDAAGAVQLDFIAKLSGGLWMPAGGASSVVYALDVFDDGAGPALVAGGSFGSVGGIPASHVARWDGTAWTALGSGIPTVEALAVLDDGADRVLFAAADQLWRWNGSAWETPGSVVGGFGNKVNALLPEIVSPLTGRPTLFVGGNFYTYSNGNSANGTVGHKVAEWVPECDRFPPNLEVDSPESPGATSQPSIQVTGRALDAESLWLEDQFITLQPDATFAGGPVTLTEGLNRIEVTAYDRAGNRAFVPLQIIRDVTAPTIEIVSPLTGSMLASSRPDIRIEYADNEAIDTRTLTLEVDGVPVAADCAGGERDGTCRTLGPLPSGTVTLRAAISDLAGNPGSSVGTTVTVSAQETTVTGTVLLPNGSPAAGAQVTVLGQPGATTATAANGTFTLPSVLATSAFSVVASYEDASGSLAGIVQDILGAVGSTTDVGALQLRPLCDLEVDLEFAEGVGVDGTLNPGSDDARVLAIEVFDDGTGGGPALYLGGEFRVAGGTPAQSLVKWDGSRMEPVGGGVFHFPGFDWGAGVVYALRVFDDGSGPALYVGGDFGCAGVNGLSCVPNTGRIARWDGSQWSAVGGSFDVSGGVLDAGVLALEVVDLGQGPVLVAGGRFTSAGGVAARNIAFWNGQTWSPLGPGLGGTQFDAVYSLATYQAVKGQGQTIYAGGDFATTGSPEFRSLRGVAAWDGQKWVQLGGGILDPDALLNGFAPKIRAMAAFNGELVVAGTVGEADGAPVPGIAAWDGRSWSDLGPDFDGSGVDALTVFDDGTGAALYALGGRLNGEFRVLARWDGTSWSKAADFGRNSTVFEDGGALHSFDDDPADGVPARLFVGSVLTRVLQTDGHQIIVNGIASWDATGWHRVGPLAPGGSISAMAPVPSGAKQELFVSGPAGGRAAFTLRWDGSSWSGLPPFWSWDTDSAGTFQGQRAASKMVTLDTGNGPELYATGTFEGAGPWQANGLAKWNGVTWVPIATDDLPGGPLDETTTNYISAMAVFDDGTGPAIVAASRYGIARWTGSSWVGIGSFSRTSVSCFQNGIGNLAVYDDGSGAGPALYAAGCFDEIGGQPIRFLARWDGSTWSPAGDFDDNVEDIAVYDDGTGPALYAAGRFTQVDGTPVGFVARRNGVTWQPAGSGFSQTGSQNRLLVLDLGSGPELWFAGYFRLVGSQYDRGLARWDGANWITLDTGTLEPLDPVVAFDDGIGPALFAPKLGLPLLARIGRPTECGSGPDTTPPTLAFTRPAPGESVLSLRPSIEVSYVDQESGVDTSTLSVQLDGSPLAVTCSFLVSAATCTPDSDLTGGTRTLTATIADAAGNTSTPAQVTFVVTAGTPSLAITSPSEGALVLEGMPEVHVAYTSNADLSTFDIQSAPIAVAFSCSTTSTSAVCTPLSPLPEGANTVTATVMGFDGSAPPPAQVAFTVDLSPPSLSFTAPTDGSFTNQEQPELVLSYADSGAGVDTSTLEIQEGGVALPVSCAFTGTEATCTPTAPLAEGPHTLTATVVDLAGRASAPAQVGFEVLLDFNAPVITLSAPVPDGITTGVDTRFVGSLDEPATLTLDGTPVNVDGTNAFDHGPVALAEGWNAFELVATDRVGNAASQTVRVLRDTIPPALAFLAPTEGTYFDPSTQPFELRWGDSGAGVDPSSLQITADGAPLAVTCSACGAGVVCTPTTPPIGTIQLEATVADLAGLTTIAQARFTTDPNADIVPPEIFLTAPVPGSVTREAEQRFLGDLSEPASLTVAGSPATVDSNGHFDYGPVVLSEGPNSIALEAMDAAGNLGSRTVVVTLDSTAPPPVDETLVTVAQPSGGLVIITGAPGSVVSVEPGEMVHLENLLSAAVVEVNPAADGSFSAVLSAVGGDEIGIATRDAIGNRSVPRLVSAPGAPALPPDPAGVAPALEPTIATGPCELYGFLYSGTDPVQSGVGAGAIDCEGASLLRGRVLDRAGLPVSGVRISVLQAPELGSTLTRVDGAFDFVVDGGSSVVLQYRKAGYLPVQRRADARWGRSFTIPDVVLTTLDTDVTPVDLSGAAGQTQVARGSAVTDNDGTRRATLLFPAGTSASLRYRGGATETASTLSIRATEFTVGPEGPASMPGDLPPTSAYTYAVEFSADEALAAGASGVVFDRPVVTYLENFLGFPTGVVVPFGSYDRELARWVPEENGRVVEVLSVTAGLADLDVDGAGVPADAVRRAELGITDAERAEVATLYAIGQSLWRGRVLHFTPYDCNFPVFPPPGSRSPERDDPRGGDHDKKNCDATAPGSIIECTNQVLGENLGLTAAPYSLHYRSDRVPGRVSARTIEISLTGTTPPPGLQRVDLTIDIAGQRLTQSFVPASDLTHSFTWDGLDTFGRPIQGAAEATVSIGYVYDATYARPPDDELEAFARPGTAELTGIPGRQQITAWQRQSAQLTRLDFRDRVGLGGWTLSAHHVYDPYSRTLYYGDGGRRTVRDVTTITSAAGTGNPGFGGDGGPAEQALISSPNSLVVSRDPSGTPDGGYYFADTDNCRVRRVDAAGTMTTVAGSGCKYLSDGITPAPASGDGGPAIAAVLHREIGQLAQGPDGSLFISDAGHFSIRRLAPDGTISTVAGFDWLHGADPGPTSATQFLFSNEPWGLTVDDAGDLYVGYSDTSGFGVILRLASPLFEPEVILQGEINNGLYHYLREPHSLTLDVAGDLYIADGFTNSIFRYGWDGSFIEVAGGCQTLPNGQPLCTGDSGDGGPATEALLNDPIEMKLAPDGSILFTDRGNHRIRQIDSLGRISTVAGTGAAGFNGDDRPARDTQLADPVGLEILPAGEVLVADASNHRIRKIEDVLPPVPRTGLILVPSEDGLTRYVFDLNGLHLRTEDARTGEVLLTFSYTAEGHLATITDAFANTTTVEHDAAGAPQAIVGPFGQRTALTVHASGYLSTVANPAGDTVGLTYSPEGLLTGLTDPRTNPYVFVYDGLGRLETDSDPATGSTTLVRSEIAPSGDVAGGALVVRTSALGRATTYRTEQLTTGDRRVTVTDPAGLATVSLQSADGSRSTTTPDGTNAIASQGPDPRFGMQAPRLETLTVTTPGGLVSTTTSSHMATFVDPSGDPEDPANVATLTDAVTVNGRTATSVQDLVARQTVTTSPEGRQGTTTFDVLGRVTELTLPGAAPVQFGYEPRGRLQTISQGTRTTTYTYDPATGFVSKVTDPDSRDVSFTYDAAGRVLTQTLPDLRAVTFAYDANGNVTSITPPGRPAHAFAHTSIDLPETYTPPDVGLAEHATTLAYNADRQVELVTRPDGQTIDPVYDPASGRLTSVLTPRGTYGYAYDPTSGNLSTVTDPDGGSLAYGYDGSLPTSVTWTGDVAGSVGFTYDDDFELVSRTVNGANAVAFGYDQDGLLTSAGALTLSRETSTGLLAGTTLGTLTDAYTYDPTYGELASYTAADGGSELYSASYTRDDLGRIEQKVETIGGITATYVYTYDPAGRLTDVEKDGAPQAHYDYDANSNRIGWTDPWGSGTATYDDQDRLTSYAGTTYTYTANGELTSKSAGGQTVNYDYDVLGNLRQVVLADGLTIDYVIDAANRRVGKKVGGILAQGFLYQDGLNPVAELDAAGTVVATFVYSSKANVPDFMVRAGTTYRVISDHVGSVRLVVSEVDGTIAQRLDYDTFGRVMLDTNPGFQPFGFAGGLYDPQTGLLRFGARDYDPETGRWTSKDPIGFAGGGSNLYGYVLADPVNFTDTSGLILDTILDVGFIIFDVYKLVSNLLRDCPDATLGQDLFALGADVVGAALPFVTGLGEASRVARYTDEAIEAAHVRKGGLKLLGPGTIYGEKIEGQLAERGWTKRLVQSSIDDPVRTVATRDTRHLPGGGRLDEPATAYYNRRGGYVVRNDRTGDIVQISDRTDATWRAPWDLP